MLRLRWVEVRRLIWIWILVVVVVVVVDGVQVTVVVRSEAETGRPAVVHATGLWSVQDLVSALEDREGMGVTALVRVVAAGEAVVGLAHVALRRGAERGGKGAGVVDGRW